MDTITHSMLFKGLTHKQIEEILEKGNTKKLNSKGILFHQGDPADTFYQVIKGNLKLCKQNENGDEVILRYVTKDHMTAAVACLKHQNYPVSAEAIGETVVVGWDRDTIMALINIYPVIAINLLDVVLARLDEMQNRYLELTSESVELRIARTLIRLAQKAGQKTTNGIQIDFPLSRQNIADFAGTTLYTVSRILSNWEKEGWIKSGRQKIIVTDLTSLIDFSQSEKFRK